jgi:hypothetical protein
VPKFGAILLAVFALQLGISHREAGSASAPQFELVGHDPVLNRGMNAGLALHRGFAYIGNRPDASQGRMNSGVLVVAIDDPSRPRVIGEIDADEDAAGLSSRELRVWPQAELLIAMNVTCEAGLHRCARPTAPPSINFFDIASAPRPTASFRPRIEPHEMFLWVDPNSDKAFLFLSTNATSADLPDLLVIDISRARAGEVREIAAWNAEESGEVRSSGGYPARLHSLSVSPDGRRGYVAHWGGGFQILDTSEVAEAKPKPNIRLVTEAGGLRWGGPAHSAVKVPGRPLVVLSDEAQDGCPWGWVRVFDVSDEARPTLAGQFRAEQNREAGCADLTASGAANQSHTSHNPTVLSNLALVTWHAAGLQAIDLENPRRPRPAGSFVPEPVESVATEDPALTGGGKGVALWSYPIIKDALIYVVDVRNGLYVLKYQGRWAEEVSAMQFAEGNSNIAGDQTVASAPSPSIPSPGRPPSTDGRSQDRSASGWWPEGPIVLGGLLLALAVLVLLRTRRTQ